MVGRGAIGRRQRLANWLPLAGGRRSPHGFGSTSTEPPAAVMAASADFEKACAFTVTARVSSPRPRTLTRAPLPVRPLACSDAGSTSSRPVASRTSRLMAWYSTRNGLLKPRSLGTRMWSGIWPPSKPAGILPRAPWPLVPRPAVLPPLPPMPRPTRLRLFLEPGAGVRSWILIVIALLRLLGRRSVGLDRDQVGDPGDHAADLGAVGRHELVGRQPAELGHVVRPALGLEPGDRGAGHVDVVGRPQGLAEHVLDAG